MKVSVIMSTHNRGDLIRNAIESVMHQTHEDWELIVVADGCTDDTNAIVSEYVEKDDRVIHFPVEKMEYYTHVRNFGIDNSDGELIAFRDDDGAWAPNFLEEAVKVHRNPNVTVTLCGRKLIEGVRFSELDIKNINEVDGTNMPIPSFVGSDSLTNLIDVGDIVIKRSVFNDGFVGFDKGKDQPGYCSDAKLVDDIYRHNPHGQIVSIPKYLHYYFQNHGGKVTNMTIRKLKHREKYGTISPEEGDFVF